MTAVMTPYRRGKAGRRVRPVATLLLLAYCGLTGAAVALFPPQLYVMLAIPIFIGVGVILWLLPDVDHVAEPAMATLFVSFIAANCIWPNYIALDLPGLPWINPPRVIVFALLALAIYGFSTSSRMRGEVADSLRAVPWLSAAFWFFTAMTLLTLPLSDEIFFSINKWVNNQIFWTFFFLLAAWLCVYPGVLARVSRVTIWSAILVALESIYEYRIQRVPWVDSIPSFLKIDEGFLTHVLSSQGRAGTDIYRAHGTFNVALTLAEYMALVFPFIIHEFLEARGFGRKLLLALGFVACVVATYLTNARSGVIGFFMSLFLYGGFYIFRHWRREKQSLIGVSILAMLPVAALAFGALSLTWQRLHNMTFGGGMQENSSLARTEQWALGWPKVFANPIGHGVGRSGNILGYFTPGGEGTIDTYYLSLLLEYGFIGFAAFMVLFAGQLIVGLRLYLDAEGEEKFVGPAVIAMLNFVVIKSVLSSEFNMPLAFIFLGMVFAVALRQRQRLGAPAPTATRYARAQTA